MSGVPLETCWAFKKRWNNKFYYKLHLVGISTESSTMHGSMSVKRVQVCQWGDRSTALRNFGNHLPVNTTLTSQKTSTVTIIYRVPERGNRYASCITREACTCQELENSVLHLHFILPDYKNCLEVPVSSFQARLCMLKTLLNTRHNFYFETTVILTNRKPCPAFFHLLFPWIVLTNFTQLADFTPAPTQKKKKWAKRVCTYSLHTRPRL